MQSNRLGAETKLCVNVADILPLDISNELFDLYVEMALHKNTYKDVVSALAAYNPSTVNLRRVKKPVPEH